MKSLRARLLMGTVLGTTTVVLVLGVALYVVLAAMLWRAFDGALADKARALAEMTDQDERGVHLDFAERRLPEFEPGKRPEYFEVWNQDGTVLARSPALTGQDLNPVGDSAQVPALASATLPGGRPGRAAGMRFQPRSEEEHGVGNTNALEPVSSRVITLVVARDTRSVEHALERLRWLLVAAGASAILACAAVLAWLVPRGLRPLERLAADIQNLDQHHLNARLSQPNVPLELAPVIQRLNELLARLETGFARERAFSADVAHELRTPVAGLRTAFEVSLSRDRPAEGYRHTLDDALKIVERLGTLVDNLLLLARAESGQLSFTKSPVPLDALLRESWQRFAAPAAARNLHLQWHTDQAGAVDTDPEMLRLVLVNLFDNAVNHSDAGGWIRIEVTATGNESAFVVIANSGSQVAAADAVKTLDRFWRGDSSRSGAGEHVGLGLSLCRRMIELLGGRIAVESEAGGAFQVTLTLKRPD